MKTGISLLPLLIPVIAMAHHGSVTNPSLYHSDDMVELEGEITEVFWENPHTRARLLVTAEDGEETIWELEVGPRPRQMERRGIVAEDLVGRVKTAGHVSKLDPHAFGVLHILLPNGQEYAAGQRELRWSEVSVADEVRRIDPESAEVAELAADGIFRVWDRRIGPNIERGVGTGAFTDRGAEFAAAYDPLINNGQLECRHGMPDTMFDPLPMEITDEGAQIRIHVEQYNIQRLVHINVERPPVDVEPSPVGYSVGRWEDDVLVVTTSHVDWPYYSGDGTPQSDQVEYLERFSTSEDGRTLHYEITITDPVVFTDPIHMEYTREALPGAELPPFNCIVEWRDNSD